MTKGQNTLARWVAITITMIAGYLVLGAVEHYDASAQTILPPTLLLATVNRDGDLLVMTYDRDRGAIDARIHAPSGAMIDNSWTFGGRADNILVSVCGGYAGVVVVGDALHSHTFALAQSFGCEEYAVWLPEVAVDANAKP